VCVCVFTTHDGVAYTETLNPKLEPFETLNPKPQCPQ